MTNGRGHYLKQAIKSAEENLIWDFDWKMIVDDSADTQYSTWLSGAFGSSFQIYPTKEPCGFCGSIQRGWNLLPEDADFVFHLEDDFTFNEPIRIQEMIDILQDNPKLAQIALLRQAVNPAEKSAGGVIQCFSNDFKQREKGNRIWMEHARFFTTNPSLYPRSISRIPYPLEDFCEGKFSIKLRAAGYRFAILGKKDQKPKVAHIGEYKAANWQWISHVG